jgi:FkbM family methyltransferase
MARVIAFEPHPDTYRRLAEQSGPGLYEAIHAAVSDRAGVAVLHDRAAYQGSQHASLVPGVIEVIHETDVRSWTVPCITLDEFLSERGSPHVHLLKVDTEGSELRVLQGVRRAVEDGRVDLIQIEFNAMNVLSRTFMRDFRDLLPRYTPHRLLPDGPVPLGRYAAASEEIFAFQNVLFVAERLPASVREAVCR